MSNDRLQRMVENLSEEEFRRTFRHCAYFNKRLRTIGGCYLLKSHDVKINPKQHEHYGEDVVVKVILHELCYYHSRITGKGYRHKDQDFKRLNQQVGASRFYNSTESYQQQANYEYYCTKYHAKYIRIRGVDANRMRYRHCNGKLRVKRQLK